MAEIKAFRAVRYADEIDPAAVTCPPYDVLSPNERRDLQNRSPYAAARLILPEGDGDAQYANAGRLFADWLRDGVLRIDEAPALYVTRTEFSEPGTDDMVRHDQLGLVGLLRLHDYADRIVLPHEKTMDRPKEDRLNLLRATGANFESIMTLADDPTGDLYAALTSVASGPPLVAFDADGGQRITLFRVTDDATIRRLQDIVAPRPVFIADGHHRYETSLAYARETGALGTDRSEAFLLTTLSSFADPGLTVLPTHRLVKGSAHERTNLIFTKLEPIFDVRESDLADLEGRLRITIQNQPIFGLVMPSGTAYQLTVRDHARLDAALPVDLPPSLRSLEAVILQYVVLEGALGIPASEVATTDRLAYTRDMAEATRRVHDGEFDLALLLGRPPVTAVRDVSLAGEVMPQKSTYFYPKLVSGLVMRKL